MCSCHVKSKRHWHWQTRAIVSPMMIFPHGMFTHLVWYHRLWMWALVEFLTHLSLTCLCLIPSNRPSIFGPISRSGLAGSKVAQPFFSTAISWGSRGIQSPDEISNPSVCSVSVPIGLLKLGSTLENLHWDAPYSGIQITSNGSRPGQQWFYSELLMDIWAPHLSLKERLTACEEKSYTPIILMISLFLWLPRAPDQNWGLEHRSNSHLWIGMRIVNFNFNFYYYLVPVIW